MPRLSIGPRLPSLRAERQARAAGSGVGQDLPDDNLAPWEIQCVEALDSLRLPILRFGSAIDRLFLFVMHAITMVDVVWVPFLCSFSKYENIWQTLTPMLVIDESLNVIYLAGSLIQLRTSAVDLSIGCEYVAPNHIFWYRMTSAYFWLDFVSNAGGLSHVFGVKSLSLLRLLRVWRLSNTSDDKYELHLARLSGGVLSTLVELVLTIVLMIHIFACVWFYSMVNEMPTFEEDFAKDPRFWGGGPLETYIFCYAQGAAMLVGWGNPEPASADLIYTISELFAVWFMAPVAAITNAFVFASLMDVVIQATEDTSKYLEEMRAGSMLMDSIFVPSELKDRVMRYLSYISVQKVNAIEDRLMNTLSKDLLLEVKLHLFDSLITAAPFFREAPPSLLTDMVMALEQEVFNPGSVLFYRGDTSTDMFFIIKGITEVLINDTTVCAHKRHGEFFGEIGLVFNQPRTATLRAKTFCILAKLSRESCQNALRSLPPEGREEMTRLIAGGVDHDGQPVGETTPLLSERGVEDATGGSMSATSSLKPKEPMPRTEKKLNTKEIVRKSLRSQQSIRGTSPSISTPLDAKFAKWEFHFQRFHSLFSSIERRLERLEAALMPSDPGDCPVTTASNVSIREPTFGTAYSEASFYQPPSNGPGLASTSSVWSTRGAPGSMAIGGFNRQCSNDTSGNGVHATGGDPDNAKLFGPKASNLSITFCDLGSVVPGQTGPRM